mmetsp:Transcript_5920/g.9228  ORF Transcript_5920/g.9228 Transcript_5920/m.9228 type:complete len:84 (-) Transcript_5920:481-732(-)
MNSFFAEVVVGFESRTRKDSLTGVLCLLAAAYVCSVIDRAPGSLWIHDEPDISFSSHSTFMDLVLSQFHFRALSGFIFQHREF